MSRLPNDREMLAVTYLLGQASAEEARAFEELSEQDAGFRALVRELEAWLAPLNRFAPEQAPPEGLLDDIMQAIETREAAAPATPAATAPAPKPAPWRAIAICAVAVALIAVASHLVPAGAPSLTEDMVALLSEGDAPQLVVILYDPEAGEVLAHMSNTAPPDEGVWELWLIRDGEETPRSLGLLDGADPGEIVLHVDAPLSAETDTLAVSLEPEGGSPDEGPSGPVIYTGAVRPI